jgi:hypothetical protein
LLKGDGCASKFIWANARLLGVSSYGIARGLLQKPALPFCSHQRWLRGGRAGSRQDGLEELSPAITLEPEGLEHFCLPCMGHGAFVYIIAYYITPGKMLTTYIMSTHISY